MAFLQVEEIQYVSMCIILYDLFKVLSQQNHATFGNKSQQEKS